MTFKICPQCFKRFVVHSANHNFCDENCRKEYNKKYKKENKK